MSAANDAASPVGGRRAWSGWAKVGAAAAGLGVLGLFIMMPGAGHNGGTPTNKAQDDNQATVEPFHPPPPLAANPLGLLGAPVGGQQHRRRLPPPLEIGAYVVASQLARPVAAAPAPDAVPAQAANGVTPVYVPAPGAAAVAAHTGPPADSLEGQVTGATVLQASSAAILAHPDFTITAGAKIPCLPVEAADSSLGGFYTCRVPEWVRGTTQTRGLLPPGTIIFGQVRKGLEQNQERLGIVFTRIETAGDHVLIRLAAPAADAIGRAGVGGDVDTFFWDRAGAVALYALIDGLQGALTQGASAGISGLAGGSFGSINIGSGGGQSLAGIELQNKINKAPVLRRDQALPIEVSVGQDLDFYAACLTRLRVNAMACPPQ